MLLIAAAMAKTGRNDPCPCGSGRKYKRCHWSEHREQRAQKKQDLIMERSLLYWSDNESGMPHLRLDTEAENRAKELERRCRDAGLPPRSEADPHGFTTFRDACSLRWEERGPDDLADQTEDLLLIEAQGVPEGDSELTKLLQERVGGIAAQGDDAVPILAFLMHTESWAGLFATQTLTGMPRSPLRDQAIVEALFSGLDATMDEAVKSVDDWDDDRAYAALRKVATAAAEDRIELQSFFWSTLFEHYDEEDRLHLSQRFPEATRLMMQHRHLNALDQALAQILNPMMAGPQSVKRLLDDPLLEETIQAIERTQKHTETATVGPRPTGSR